MNWKVSKEAISVFPHHNADSLELAKVGQYQLVIGKGSARDGDAVVFIPAKSLLPENLHDFFPHAHGGRVREVNLRGESSQGVTLTEETVRLMFYNDPETLAKFYAAAPGEDVSALFGITKYEPPIPAKLAGEVAVFAGPVGFPCEPHRHDVVQHGVYGAQFGPSEEVVITEKLHGSQAVFFVAVRGGIADPTETQVGSKGLFEKGLVLKPSADNLYWRAARAVGIEGLAEQVAAAAGLADALVHFIGEVVPCQRGYAYGFDNTKRHGHNAVSVRFFAVLLPGHADPALDALPVAVQRLWVPILYRGPLSGADVFALAQGRETVSGEETHIREGCVITPLTRRRAADGTWLKTKVINPKYAAKATGEELS